MTGDSGSAAARDAGAAIAEAARLRRCDWRFLLPAPAGGAYDRLVVLGGPPGVVEDVKRLGVAREVLREPPAGRDADAVVALRGARVGPADARRWLRDGGVLLLEVDRRTTGRLGATPARTRRALRRKGFVPLGTWWAKPGLERCGMYLPLESSGALAWYYERVHAPRSAPARVARSALRLLTGWKAERFARLVPTYVVTARVGQGESGGSGVLGRPGVPASLRPPRARPLLLLGGEGAWSRVVVMPFGPDANRPETVLKHPRLACYNAATRRERSTLRSLRARVGSPLCHTLPAPLSVTRWQGVSVSIERCMPGRSLYAVCAGGGPREAIAAIRLAASWLAAFHRRTVVDRPRLGEPDADRLIDEPFVRYVDALGCDAAERRLFDAARDRAASLAGTAVPVVWQHRDFAPWNVHRAGWRIGVIDWEVARPGPALCDLLYFALHWLWIARGHDAWRTRRRDFHSLYVDPGAGDRLVATCRREIDRYMERLEVEPALLPLLLVTLLVEQALDRVDRLRDAGGAAGPRDANPYVGYLGVLAGEPERLFGGIRA